MPVPYKSVVIAGVVLAATLGVAPVSAQQSRDRVVEQFLCKDVVRESGGDRDVAIAFLHGFLLGKSGSSKFNLDELRKQSDTFIERCLDNLSETAVDAMSKVKN